MVPGLTSFQVRQNRTTQRQTLPKNKKTTIISRPAVVVVRIMGYHPLPVPLPLHPYRILPLPHRGYRSASAPSRYRLHSRILTVPVPTAWVQGSAVTVNTIDTTGCTRQLAAVPPSRCRAGRVRRAEPLFREATDSHVPTWDVLRPYGTTVHTFGVEDGSHTVPASRSTVCSHCRPSPP